MKREDFLSILITFLMGAVIGGYLYLTETAPLVTKLATPKAESVARFSLVAEVYGGCGSECQLFRINPDGSYRYFHYDADGKRIVEDGELPLALSLSLEKGATVEDLVTQSKPRLELCESSAEEVQAKYTFELDGKDYQLDSCATTVDEDGPLWVTLKEMWVYFGKYE